ncbi:MAG: hypothetical protein IPJ06_00750 [Saprospiraceae bacterium]|nr:hypothetical protein [Saprospiraceae bacterium]
MKKFMYLLIIALLMMTCHKDDIVVNGISDLPVSGKIIYKKNNRILLSDLSSNVHSVLSADNVILDRDFRISNDGQRIAYKHVGNSDEDPRFYIRVIDIESMEAVNTMEGMDHRTTGMAWSPDGSEVATINYPTNSIRIFTVNTGRYRDVFLPGEMPYRFDLANSLLDWSGMDEFVFSVRTPDYPYSMGDMRLAFMFADGSGFRLLVPDVGEYSTVDYPRDVRFSPDGNQLILRKGWVVSQTVIIDRFAESEQLFWDNCINDPSWSGNGQFIMATYIDETDLVHPKVSIQVREVNGAQKTTELMESETYLLDWWDN